MHISHWILLNHQCQCENDVRRVFSPLPCVFMDTFHTKTLQVLRATVLKQKLLSYTSVTKHLNSQKIL